MKILALSDIHGDQSLVKEMALKAAENKVDLVILAGDLVGHDGSIQGLIGPFKEKGLDVGILPGNHEGMSEINFLVEKYGIKNMHGYSLQKDNIGIFGCGYSNVGVHQLNEEDFFKTLKNSAEKIKNLSKKIMVTHTHPDKSILGLGVFPGSKGIRKAIDELQPDFHLCGHMHETEGIEEMIGKTRVINVGRKGKIIEL